jgi:hypothetical protein
MWHDTSSFMIIGIGIQARETQCLNQDAMSPLTAV